MYSTRARRTVSYSHFTIRIYVYWYILRPSIFVLKAEGAPVREPLVPGIPRQMVRTSPTQSSKHHHIAHYYWA